MGKREDLTNADKEKITNLLNKGMFSLEISSNIIKDGN